MKISYIAWKNKVSIKQLILEAIIFSYVSLNQKREGVIFMFNINKYIEQEKVTQMI